MRGDLERPSLGAGGRLRATTVGINLDLGANRTRLTLNGVSRRAGAAQTQRRSLIAQVQVRF